MIPHDIRRELLTVDWNFPTRFDGAFRSQHWYPGTFPTELPGTIIQALTSIDDVVLDPYGGVGTTATEALRLGRRAWHVELNRPATLAAYVSGSFVLLKRSQPAMATSLLSALRSMIQNLGGGQLFKLDPADIATKEVDEFLCQVIYPNPIEFLKNIFFDDTPNWESLECWYHRRTLDQIVRIVDMLRHQETAMLTLLGTMCLSACLRPLSSQTRSWGHIADNVLPKTRLEKDTARGLKRWLSHFDGNLRRTDVKQVREKGDKLTTQFYVSLYDWLDGTPIDASGIHTVSLLITSPPYGGAIDYILSQRLSYYLFGATVAELIAHQRIEIGARRKRSRSNAREEWATDLSAALGKQRDWVAEDGTIAIVLPHKSEGRSNGNEMIDQTLRNGGWMKELSIDRSIHTMRTRQAWSSIKQETVSVYKRRQSWESE